MDFHYHAEAQLHDGSAELLDLEVKGWADKARLDQTRVWSLVPKEGAKTMNGDDYPIVCVNVPEGAKPIFFSRVYGKASLIGEEVARDRRFRCYAIGWKKGRTKFVLWVLPTGDIEVGEEPHLPHAILAQL